MSQPHSAPPGPARQRAIYLDGIANRRPRVPVETAALEKLAAERMSVEAYAYIADGAGTNRTMAANRAAFDRHAIVPRMLRDVSTRDLTVELLGRTLRAPLLLAPIGVLELANREADLAVARAAAATGVPMIFSNQASVPMERCAEAMGASPRWLQLYWNKSDALMTSFVRRAEACGCEALVVTLDTPFLGWRARDLDQACLPFFRGQGLAQYYSDAVFQNLVREPLPGPPSPKPPLNLATLGVALQQARRYPGGTLRNLFSGTGAAAVHRFGATYAQPSLTWENLPWLRQLTRLPIFLKGILHPDDARRAIETGVNGLIVSNHGGRQVDGAIAALDALPAIVAAVEDRMPVLFDSGIRSGADMFKAIALGARAVLLGRPYVYGLACGGQKGVEEVIENVIAEFDLTLALSGLRSTREITRAALA